jgi:hypothetical protein
VFLFGRNSSPNFCVRLSIRKRALRIGAIFESRDNILGVPDNEHAACRLMLLPVFNPEVEDVVQIFKLLDGGKVRPEAEPECMSLPQSREAGYSALLATGLAVSQSVVRGSRAAHGASESWCDAMSRTR